MIPSPIVESAPADLENRRAVSRASTASIIRVSSCSFVVHPSGAISRRSTTCISIRRIRGIRGQERGATPRWNHETRETLENRRWSGDVAQLGCLRICVHPCASVVKKRGAIRGFIATRLALNKRPGSSEKEPDPNHSCLFVFLRGSPKRSNFAPLHDFHFHPLNPRRAYQAP